WLSRRIGKREQAQEHLTTATTMYRENGHALLLGSGGGGADGLVILARASIAQSTYCGRRGGPRRPSRCVANPLRLPRTIFETFCSAIAAFAARQYWWDDRHAGWKRVNR